MEFYLVDVKSISVPDTLSKAVSGSVEPLAQSIVASGGLTAPLLLRKLGPEAYELLSEPLHYYAACRAREINPRQFETVNAFVVTPERQEAAIYQVVEQYRTC